MRKIKLPFDSETYEESVVPSLSYMHINGSDSLKRYLDIVLSITGLAICAPIMILLYLIIKFSGDEPIYQQERIGYRGEPFIIYKFRSMRPNAEERDKPKLCEENDTRLTAIGKFMRERHLDELPQLWNVLKGDMSIVGPRPERQYFIDQITSINANYVHLYSLRPGLFSVATLINGYTDTIDKMLIRLRLDLEYLRDHNIMVDVKIIYLTLKSIFTGKKF